MKEGLDSEPPLSTVKTAAEHFHSPPIDGWKNIKQDPSVIKFSNFNIGNLLLLKYWIIILWKQFYQN